MSSERFPRSRRERLDASRAAQPKGQSRRRQIWSWLVFVIRVNLARLRFVAIIVAIGVVITQWDTLAAYYERWTRSAADSATAHSEFEWFCPMHPSVVRDNPRDKCPICFMPLSKRKKGTGRPDPLPAGVTSRVQLSPYRVVLAGVDVWRARPLPLVKEITTVGYVEFNEEKQRIVSARVAGRIDELLANQTGRMVRKGDNLAKLYSPELVVTMQDLLDAQASGEPRLVESSKTRLRLFGIDEDQMQQALKDGKAPTHLMIRSPISGHIIRKGVVEGQYVEEGTTLYELADLSSVWIAAQIYEDDVPFLDTDHAGDDHGTSLEGVEIAATTPVLPDNPFTAKQAFVFPHVNPATRTVTLRFEVDNPGHQLRPGATATVRIRVPASKMPMFKGELAADGAGAKDSILAVPESSVIDTGNQAVVYRESSPGVFEGISVIIGPRMADDSGVVYFPILRGIEEGDRIVTNGSFLIDAETRLNPAAGSIYFGGSAGGHQSHEHSSVVRPSTPEDPKAMIDASLASLDPLDESIAREQRFCPVLKGSELGSMGPPVKVTIEGDTLFVCCEGCVPKTESSPGEVLSSVQELRRLHGAGETDAAPPDEDPDITDALNSLSPEDAALARRQRFCAVQADSLLGSMGPPIKVALEGNMVFLCCKGCRATALKDPAATIRRWKEQMDQH